MTNAKLAKKYFPKRKGKVAPIEWEQALSWERAAYSQLRGAQRTWTEIVRHELTVDELVKGWLLSRPSFTELRQRYLNRASEDWMSPENLEIWRQKMVTSAKKLEDQVLVLSMDKVFNVTHYATLAARMVKARHSLRAWANLFRRDWALLFAFEKTRSSEVVTWLFYVMSQIKDYDNQFYEQLIEHTKHGPSDDEIRHLITAFARNQLGQYSPPQNGPEIMERLLGLYPEKTWSLKTTLFVTRALGQPPDRFRLDEKRLELWNLINELGPDHVRQAAVHHYFVISGLLPKT